MESGVRGRSCATAQAVGLGVNWIISTVTEIIALKRALSMSIMRSSYIHLSCNHRVNDFCFGLFQYQEPGSDALWPSCIEPLSPPNQARMLGANKGAT